MEKLFQNRKQYVALLFLLLISGLCIFCIHQNVSAALPSGTMYYYHGVSGTFTIAGESSTKKESSMKLLMPIRYYEGANAGNTVNYVAGPVYSFNALDIKVFVDGTSGSSLCYYYVNGTKQYTASDWWYFDYT